MIEHFQISIIVAIEVFTIISKVTLFWFESLCMQVAALHCEITSVRLIVSCNCKYGNNDMFLLSNLHIFSDHADFDCLLFSSVAAAL